MALAEASLEGGTSIGCRIPASTKTPTPVEADGPDPRGFAQPVISAHHLPKRPDRRPGGPIATPPGPDTTNSRAARGTGEARQDSVVNSSRSIWWTVRSGMALLRIMDRRPSESGDGHSRLSTGAGGPSRAILQSRTGADAIHIMTVTAQARR